MVLSYDSYQKTIEMENEKNDKLTGIEQEVTSMKSAASDINLCRELFESNWKKRIGRKIGQERTLSPLTKLRTSRYSSNIV